MVLYPDPKRKKKTSMSGMMDLLDSFSNNLHPLDYHPLWVYLGDLLRWHCSLLSDWLCRLPVAAYTLLPWSWLRLRCSLFASSICLGCQLGGKCCDSTHFLSGGVGRGGSIHPSATPMSHCWRTSTPFPDSGSDTQLNSKEDFCLGLDTLHQSEGK